MTLKNPSIVPWVLSRLGVDVSAPALGRSVFLRWLVNSLGFLITWGLFVVVAWTVLDERNALGPRIACTVGASVLYGLLVAVERRVPAAPGHR